MIIIFANWFKSTSNFLTILVHCGPIVLNKVIYYRCKTQETTRFRNLFIFQLLWTMLTIYGFQWKNNLWIKSHVKSFNVEPFCLLIKNCVTAKRTCVNIRWNFLNPNLKTVLYTLPFDKLPKFWPRLSSKKLFLKIYL